MCQNEKKSSEVMSIGQKLFNDRVIFLVGPVTTEVAAQTITQILALEAADPCADISLYLNTPGGSVIDGLAIIDAMNLVSCDIATYCIGMCASMGAHILCAGTVGKRYVLPNSEVLIHQLSGGAQGQETDVAIAAERMKKERNKLNKIMAKQTGKSVQQISDDTERDFWMDAKEAIEYGLADKIAKKHKKPVS